MYALLNLIHAVISIYYWVLICSAVMSWLIAFNVVNTRNQLVAQLSDLLYRLTEPVLRPIRRVIPTLGGVDISFVVAILLLYFINDLLYEYVG